MRPHPQTLYRAEIVLDPKEPEWAVSQRACRGNTGE